MPETMRRTDDMRIEKIETSVGKMQDDIVYIKTKIDNGFSHSIKNTEDRLTRFESRYDTGHDDLIKKIDKILFLWVSGSISIAIAVILFLIEGLLK